MAQETVSETAPAKTREQRVTFKGDAASFAIVFKMPGGEVVELDHLTLPGATHTHCLQYGIRRVFQDGLSGRIKDGESADDVAADLIARFKSGDWTGRRGSGDGKPTLEAFARSLAKIADPKADKEALASKVAEWKANASKWSLIETRYEAAYTSLDD